MERRSSVKSPDSVFMAGLKADARAGLIAPADRFEAFHLDRPPPRLPELLGRLLRLEITVPDCCSRLFIAR